MWKKVVLAGAAAEVLGIAYIASDADRREVLLQVTRTSGRIANLVGTVGRMANDYRVEIKTKKSAAKSDVEQLYIREQENLKALQSDQERDTIVQLTTKDMALRKDMTVRIAETRTQIDISSEKIASLSKASGFQECHLRNAVRLRDMCSTNKGIYIKLGQHLAMLDYILPEEYTKTLSSLLARTPTSSWEDVEKTLCEEFQVPQAVPYLFDSIETEPIASASLAQVHVAYKDGMKLAVKVQHRGLLEESTMDCLGK
jgi:hypothetical protein